MILSRKVARVAVAIRGGTTVPATDAETRKDSKVNMKLLKQENGSLMKDIRIRETGNGRKDAKIRDIRIIRGTRKNTEQKTWEEVKILTTGKIGTGIKRDTRGKMVADMKIEVLKTGIPGMIGIK